MAAATRRHVLHALAATPAMAGALLQAAEAQETSAEAGGGHGSGHGARASGGNRLEGALNPALSWFDPHKIATEWDFGVVTEENGRPTRTWQIDAADIEVEVAPGVLFPAWTFNNRIPGPALRCKEGERLRIIFNNGSSHPHSMHFHGIHSARMDGVPGAGLAESGGTFVYEFDAKPFGCHLYHCHAIPLKRHIHKGMYGAFVIDPDPERHPEARDIAAGRLAGAPEHARWQEFVMVMNGFDTNFDDENEFYAVNSIPFAYFDKPLRVERSRPVRIYLVNMTEFDPINSLHLHANFFDYYDHGTTLTPTLRTIDTVMQCQGQRGILEFSYAEHEPGLYMFHAHQSEFAELGWMSHFEVV